MIRVDWKEAVSWIAAIAMPAIIIWLIPPESHVPFWALLLFYWVAAIVVYIAIKTICLSIENDYRRWRMVMDEIEKSRKFSLNMPPRRWRR